MDPNQETPAQETNDNGGTLSADSAAFFGKAFANDAEAPSTDGAPPASEPTPTTDGAPPASEPAPPASNGDNPFDALATLQNTLAKAEGDAPAASDPSSDEFPEPEDVSKATEKARNSWRQMKDIIKERTRQLRELETELKTERERKPEVQKEEYEQLRAAVEEKDKYLFAADVRQSSEFREAVAEPLQKINERIKALADKKSIPMEDMARAFSEENPDRQEEMLGDIASSLSEFERLRFYETVREHNRLKDVESRIIHNSKEAWQRIEQHRTEEAEKSKQDYRTKLDKSLEKTWGAIQEAVPLFRPQEGNEGWNKTLADIDRSARELDFDGLPPENRALVAYRSTIAPVAVRMLVDLWGEHQKVTAELQKIRGATPKAGGDPSPDTGSDAPLEEGSSILDAIRREFSS